jgi:hypothetical protein
MPKKAAPPPPYPGEIRRRLIELVRAGRLARSRIRWQLGLVGGFLPARQAASQSLAGSMRAA